MTSEEAEECKNKALNLHQVALELLTQAEKLKKENIIVEAEILIAQANRLHHQARNLILPYFDHWEKKLKTPVNRIN